MNTKKTSTTEWFVEVLNSFTNGVVAEMVGVSQVEPESVGLGRPSKDGRLHNFWRCGHAQIQYLYRSKPFLQALEFNAYVRYNNYGPADKAPWFMFDQPKQKSRKRPQTARRPA